MVKETQRHRPTSHHKSTTKIRWGKGRGMGRGMGRGRGGDDNTMANPTTPGYLPFLKTFGFVFLSPPLCGFLFVAGKTDGPGICFTLQYLRKGFNSFPLTALYHVFTPHSGEVK